MTKGNGQDRGAARAELARRLMQLAPRQRLDALVEGKDARGLVRSVAEEDLYLAIAEVGLVDAAEVVQLASPEQFRTCVDLGAWKGQALDSHQLLAWLRAARGEDDEEFLRKVHGLDLEAIELLLRELTVMHDLEENPDANPEGVTFETPEGRYLIELKAEGLEQSTLRMVLNALIAENPFEAVRLFEAVRWEMTAELEETALQFRAARLADLGFPPLYETLALFTYLDPAKLSPKAPAGGGAGQALEAPGRVDYLEAAFRGLDSGEAEALSQELRYLVNSALVAEGAEPGDPSAVRRIGEQARDYLALGLEHLSGGDPSRAAEVVREYPSRQLFQLGFSLTLGLKHRVERLAREPRSKHEGVWWALAEETALLEALLRKRPLRALKVDGAEPAPFRSRKEIADSHARLDRVERQLGVFASLVGERPAEVVGRFGVPLPKLGAEALFTAAVAQAVLDENPDPRPVAESRLVELCERLFEGDAKAPTLRRGAVERAGAAIAERVPKAAREEVLPMVERVLAKLLAEMGEAYLSQGRVEPKLLSALPVAGQAVL
ncbi:MAG: DUF6178 family protein [Myxococcaceae bacterium]